jgi:propanediol dehydratase small subunit
MNEDALRALVRETLSRLNSNAVSSNNLRPPDPGT